MLVQTKWFGEVEISDDKVITFEKGLMGFDEFKTYTVIYDSTGDERNGIMWLQSLEEVSMALPVIDPMFVREDYDPVVEDELLKAIGIEKDTEFLVLVTMTVPSDITQMTVNLKAPIVINAENLKACQVIADNEEYMVKYPVYEILQERKGKDGE